MTEIEEAELVRDPVCGMMIEPQDAVSHQAYKAARSRPFGFAVTTSRSAFLVHVSTGAPTSGCWLEVAHNTIPPCQAIGPGSVVPGHRTGAPEFT